MTQASTKQSNLHRAMASLADLVTLETEETAARLEMNAAKWEIEAGRPEKTPRASALAARRAARCRELAKQLRIEAQIETSAVRRVTM